MPEPFEALRLPELPDGPAMKQAFTAQVIAIAGSPRLGDYADAAAYTLRYLRANPEQADVLLGRAERTTDS